MTKQKHLLSRAIQLRKDQTEAERSLWSNLRDHQIEGFKFRRQQSIGGHIVDFVNFEKKIVIELDGGQHAILHDKDKKRDEWLRSEGYRVLRFWDNEIFENQHGVLETIRGALLSPSPNPFHEGRGNDL